MQGACSWCFWGNFSCFVASHNLVLCLFQVLQKAALSGAEHVVHRELWKCHPLLTKKKKKRKTAANLLSSNPRSPALLLHPFSRLLRAAAVAPCLLSALEVSGVRLSWAAAFSRNCRCHITAKNKTHYFHHAFIYFDRSVFRLQPPADTTQRETHTQTVECNIVIWHNCVLNSRD